MKLSISKKLLLNTLLSINSVVERKQTERYSILSNLLLNASDNRISITVTDLKMQLSMCVDVDYPVDFSATLSVQKLLDICRVLSDEAQIELKVLEDKQDYVAIKAGNSRFSLRTLPVDTYPMMNESAEEVSLLSISQGDLKTLLKHVEFSMASDDIRHYLNGVLFKIEGTTAYAVATDGHRLSFSLLTLASEHAHREVIIPRKVIKELMKLLADDSDTPVDIKFSGSQINFCFANVSLTSKVIDGKFPDYNKVLPVANTQVLAGKRSDLLAVLQRVAVLCDEKYHGIRMLLTKDSLNCVSSNGEQENAEETISVKYQGENLDICFNVTYLIEMLTIFDEEEVALAFLDANSSCLITLPNNPNYKYVVMPMRI